MKNFNAITLRKLLCAFGFVLLLLSNQWASGANAVSTGNMNMNAATFNGVGAGCPAGSTGYTLVAGDNLNICPGNTVTITANSVALASITIQPGGKLVWAAGAFLLNMAAGGTITNNGTIDMSLMTGAGGIVFANGAGTRTINCNAGSTWIAPTVFTGTGGITMGTTAANILNINGPGPCAVPCLIMSTAGQTTNNTAILTLMSTTATPGCLQPITGTAVTFNNNVGGTLNIGTNNGANFSTMNGLINKGTLNINSSAANFNPTLTATAAGNTVNYTCTAAQTVIPVASYVNIGLSGALAKTWTTTTTVSGVLTLDGAATCAAPATLVNIGTVGTAGTGFTMAATALAAANFTGGAAITFQDINMITGANAAASLTPGNFAHIIKGNFTHNAGTFNGGTISYNFNSTTAAQTISGTVATTFPAVIINNTFAGGVTNTGTMTVNTTNFTSSSGGTSLFTNSGTFTTSAAIPTVVSTAATTFNIVNNGTANFGTGAFQTTTSGTAKLTLTTGAAGTTTFGGAITTAAVAGENITITNNNITNVNAAVTVGAGTAINITNAANATLNVNSATNTFAPTTAGFIVNANPNLVNYSGAAQTVVSPATSYYNLTLSGSGVKTMPGAPLTIGGDFTTAGTCTATSGNTMAITGNVFINGTSGFTGGGAMTIGGNVTINGGTFTNGAFTHNLAGNWIHLAGTYTAAGAATINMNGAAAQTIGGALTITTTFQNLTLSPTVAGTNINLTVASNAMNVNGTLSVSANAIVNPNAALNIGGAGNTLSGSGTCLVTGGTDFKTQYAFATSYTINLMTVNYAGAGAQNINSTAQLGGLAANQYGFLITSGGGTKTIVNAAVTVVNDVTINSPTTLANGAFNLSAVNLTNNNGATFTGSGGILALTGLLSNAGTFNQGGTTINLTTATGKLSNTANGVFNQGTGNTNIAGTGAAFTVAAGPPGSYSAGSGTLTLSGGDFVNNGTFNANTGTVAFTSGAVGQNISGATTPAVFNNLTINNTFAGGGVTLSSGNASVGGTLAFTNGLLNTGANTLTITNGAAASITGAGAGKYVFGNLIRQVNAIGNYVFEIGNAANYLPVALNFTAAPTTPGLVQAKFTAGAHPQIATSDVNTAKYVNGRYWTLSNPGAAAGGAFNATFNFIAPGDILGGANTASFVTSQYNALPSPTWIDPTPMGAQNPTNTTVNGLTFAANMGDFVLGEAAVPNITGQPTASVALCAGTTVTCTVAATGYQLNYQWRKNGANLANGTVGGVTTAATTATLTISGTTAPAQSGTYDVVVSNASSTTVTSTGEVVEVDVTPTITTQPTSTVTCVSTAISFTTAAVGTTNPKFQWQKNGANIGGATTATYSIASAATTDNGTYTVIISNAGCGSATSNPATLVVNTTPTVTTQPTSTVTCVGIGISFATDAVGTTNPQFQWQKNGAAISAATNATATTATFSIAAAATSDNGTYTVVVSNTGCTAATSNPATLLVNTTPTVTTQPTSTVTCVGTGISFASAAVGTTNPQFQWQKNGAAISAATNATATTATFSIAAAATSDNGTYTVVVSNTGCTAATSNPATLLVNTTPTVTTQPTSTVTCVGTGISFASAAVGTTNPQFQWQKNGAAISAATNATATTATFSIAAAATSDNGTYTVVVSNTGCTAATSNPATLLVNTTPTVTTQPTSTVTCVGTGISFASAAVGTTNPQFQWQKNGAAISAATNATATTATFSIAAAATSDNGTYTVVVSNTGCTAATSNPATLLVNTTPTVTTQPTSTVTCVGTGISFASAAVGTTNPQFQWQKNGAAISAATNATATTATFSIAAAATSDNGTYTVVVSNTGCTAATSNPATLLVNTTPTVTTQPTSTVTCVGTGISFASAAVGTTNPQFQWQKNGAAISAATNATATTATFSIAAAATSDNGTYTVVVSNTGCTAATSNPATLLVDIAPHIVTQPTPTTVCITNPVSLTVDAGTTTNANYQWQYNGTNINAATNATATTATYSIASPAAADNGTYTVVISNAGCGSTASTPVVLIVNTPPNIVSVSNDTTVCVNNPINLKVVATGTNLHYQWFVDYGLGGGSRPAAGATATTATYALPPVSTNDNGTYTVVVTNAACTSATFRGVNVVVNSTPTITTQPTLPPVVCEGDNVTFTVAAIGTNLKYTWTKNGVAIAGQNGTSFTINPAHAINDNAQYAVIVSNGACTAQTSNPLNLVIAPQPAITLNPIAVTQCAGTTATFTVGATGTGLTYQWRKNHASNVPAATAAMLTLANITPSDAANYSVIVTSICGTSVETPAVPLVVNTSPVITVPPVAITQCEGTTASFTVAATGTGLTYQWRKAGVALTDGGSITGAATPTLVIANITASDALTYYVLVSGTCAPADSSGPVALTVNTAPVITANPLNQVQCENTTAIFTVTATGTGITYHWRKNTIGLSDGANIAGSATATLTLTGIAQFDAGSYDVVVSGVCSPIATSLAATLKVNPSAFTGTILGNESVCEGDNQGSVSVINFTGTIAHWESSADGATWDTIANTTTTQTYANLKATTYYRVIAKDGVCNGITSPLAEIKVNAKPVVDFAAPSEVKVGVLVTFSNTSTVPNGIVNQSIWNFGDGNSSVAQSPQHKYDQSGTYKVVLTVYSDKGCVDSANHVITVTGDEFLVTNVITANGNGENDTWYVDGIEKFSSSEVHIYNRYGLEVFHDGPYKNNWDGTFNGARLPDGTYFYVLKITDKGTEKTYKGSITLIQ